MRVVATVDDPRVIRQILTHLGLPRKVAGSTLRPEIDRDARCEQAPR